MDGRRNELSCAEVGFGSIVGTGCSTWNIIESESGEDGLGAVVCDFASLGNGWCLNALELPRRMLPGLDVPRGTLMGRLSA
jgi:hypothetical protein